MTEKKSSPASSISDAVSEIARAMHAQGVTHVKARCELAGDGYLDIELHVPVPRVLSPTMAADALPPPVDHDEDEAPPPEWKRASAALDRELFGET